MTSYSPRIYIYKITFDEVLYYYYGVHKEKKFGEEYLGSPKTNKWCWDFYIPKKQVLEIFDYTDEGWMQALEVEKRLIKPFFNDDKWCLNEHCGGKFSIKHQKEAGKMGGIIAGKMSYELGIGVHGRTKEKMSEDGRKGGMIAAKVHQELGLGLYSLTTEQRSENGKRNGKKCYELGVGIHGRTKEQMRETGKKSGLIAKKMKVGIHGRTKEQMSEDGRKGGLKCKENKTGVCGISPEQQSIRMTKTNLQKWECLETGFITNPGNLTKYQKARGIDTSKRKRVA